MVVVQLGPKQSAVGTSHVLPTNTNILRPTYIEMYSYLRFFICFDTIGISAKVETGVNDVVF